MSYWIDSLNHVSEIWFGAVSGVVVQSIFVVAIAWVAARLLRTLSASLRFWIWQAAALKLLLIPFSIIVVLPFWPTPSATKSETISAQIVTPTAYESAETFVSVPPPDCVPAVATFERAQLTALTYAFVGWLLIGCVQLIRCFRRKRRLAVFLANCTPATEEHCNRLQQLAQKLGLKTSVRLVRGDVRVPLVTGIASTTIILPTQREFAQSTFDQVILHELAHVKRRDLVWVWLPEVLRMLFFFHPLVYWIQQQAKLHSEMACDELVLSAGSRRRDYARTLLELASPAVS